MQELLVEDLQTSVRIEHAETLRHVVQGGIEPPVLLAELFFTHPQDIVLQDDILA